MALLSFADSAPRAYRLKVGNAYLTFSTSTGASPATAEQPVNHGFSMHSTSEICWVGGGDVSNRTGTQHYSLLAVSEQHAIEFIRRLVIGELRRLAYEEFFKPVKFS